MNDRPDERLERRLAALRGDALRARAAGDELNALAPAEAAAVLGRLVRAARDRKGAATAVAALSRALARGEVDAERAAAILACARSRADRLVEALFAQGPAARSYDRHDEPFVDRRMVALSPGERRALSRSRDIDLLVRLAHDQDPRVIQELLQNPRLTEREAVLVASRRPTHAHVLEAVLGSRFGNLRRVRRAIAHNPYSSVAQAVRALATLPAEDLREIAADFHVAPQVRRHAAALRAGRRSTAAERDRPPSPGGWEGEAADLLRELEAQSGGEAEELEIVPLDPAGNPIGEK